VTSPAAPTGTNGWFVGNVTLAWLVADPGSPVAEVTNCGNQTISTDGTSTFSCSARSSGGTSVGMATIKRDASAPSKPKFKGIKKSYPHGAKPIKKKVKCTSKDPQSKVKCKIKGFSTKPGKHTLTAIATNQAGLVTKKKFKYTIA
jgi:hypothetical protein